MPGEVNAGEAVTSPGLAAAADPEANPPTELLGGCGRARGCSDEPGRSEPSSEFRLWQLLVVSLGVW